MLEGALTHVFRFPSQSTKSLHPPSYIHDVSFWYKGDDEFDEARFKDIVAREMENMMESVSCTDTFRPGDLSNRVSYCYRVVYCSRHQVLSRMRARDLQLKLREAMQQELKTVLR